MPVRHSKEDSVNPVIAMATEPNSSNLPLSSEYRTKNIKRILQDYKQGSCVEYVQLLHSICNPSLDPATLLSWIKEFQQCASYLGQEFEPLVKALLQVNWSSRGPKMLKEYRRFVTRLISAHSVYLASVLRMLAKNLVPSDPLLVFAHPNPEAMVEEHKAAERSKFTWVHETLQVLLTVAPATPKFLLPVLADSFPWIKKSSHVTNGYAENLLGITTYLPELRVKILELILHRMTELDVNAPKEDIWDAESLAETVDRPNEAGDDTQFKMDGVGEGDKDCVKDAGDEKKDAVKHEMADKLDSLMSTMMVYVRDTCFKNDEFQLEEARLLHKHLLQVFDKVILPTHASSHVQFLLFYFCSFRQAIIDAFLEFLWKRFTNPNTPAVLRQSSASYIASFVSRADYLPLSTVTACLDLLSGWLHSYIDNQEVNSRLQQDVCVHGPFYSLCQAVFYIFIFRHRQLLADNKGLHYVMGLNLERVVTCRLNPLRVCLPSIVNMFATLTRKYQIAYCYTIIERNNRSLHQVAKLHSSGSATQPSTNSLDSFFPFDPYLLPRSGKFVQSLYRQWEGCKPDEDTSKREEEEDEFVQYEEWDKDLPLGITPTTAACISPGFRS
ncbi:RNA polymerase I-specific transcription initiation factor RRN3-like isoform X1 [Acanthaster planci]|uniref:RNA polymerase I-specific transcription initiation factor RRN3-like isoform X1 n=1 Tax=Acanthaster planci TaxID=133434 RepID=A0A8B7YGZ4_ACAPL|nr:RNA polymerase I-specific transcription initiation factor RRN3-like isoform X1 [Acanthaster planci]XP_022092512.1 RNA polymerase I-specific transcription initiation factor RRN3-like isoform X2 [Acanthaster planci]XP_022092513.1 RNA polymerase I-specific transcription initiation factor RRN3-like isoform X1 [Acanthaster planci]XP_022092514.1 RNA polymerase I-specific transcription initiation factor RRN3-like isoform X1 [Acanthaster planci]